MPGGRPRQQVADEADRRRRKCFYTSPREDVILARVLALLRRRPEVPEWVEAAVAELEREL